MKDRKQIGALAYSNDAESGLRVLLVTSRETGRWVIPKGWPMKSKLPHQAAAQEAFEEAGVEGHIAKKAAGTYRYPKTLRNGDVVSCRVKVYPMEVSKLASRWPEAQERRRQWFSTEDAAAAVVEPELARLLRSMTDLIRPAQPGALAGKAS
ncbi:MULTISPECIES: NUDIX hydrolase [Aureimonas]|uniref:NUDIX hydrolase n=1 Tax=Aureimonas ureilytica TaxID=401562 RepID=A0A175RA68_9HYPH|nr:MULTISPECIES: NUDIX hydrolase [Aureimonas]KTQ96853.1 NUDIX hydrolase [Aureimonas ureilytica]